MTSNVIPIRPNQHLPTGPECDEPTPQEVRRLARALVVALNIAPGESLVLTLGNGDEASNFEAVASWVRESLVREGLPARRAALIMMFRFALPTIFPCPLMDQAVRISPHAAFAKGAAASDATWRARLPCLPSISI